jgi:asparagine synthase (glutamine-hydrolysing)
MLAQSLLPVGLRHAGRAAIGRGVIPSYLDREWFEAEGVNIDNEAENLIGRFDTLKEHLIDNVERGSLPNLLRYADRNAMAASIESRVPFLTADFAEFLMSLPPAYLVSPEGVRKFVFREAMKGILPEPIRQRRDKIGFFADDSLWLRKNRAALEPAAKELGRLPMFRAPALARFFADFWSGKHDKGALVWRALVFGYWFQDVRRIASEATA